MVARDGTPGRFIVHADQALPAFLELESAIKTHRHNDECDCPESDEELGNNRRQSQQSRLEFGATSQRLIPAQTIFVADAHHDDGKRFIVRADEKLTAFMELEAGAVRPLPAGTAGPLDPAP